MTDFVDGLSGTMQHQSNFTSYNQVVARMYRFLFTGMQVAMESCSPDKLDKCVNEIIFC